MSMHRRGSDATRSACGHEIAKARTAKGLWVPHRSIEAPCASALRWATPARRVFVGMKVPSRGFRCLSPRPSLIQQTRGRLLLAPLGQVGTAISQARPSVRQSRYTRPFMPSRIMLSITPVPKPLRVGGLTGGPPVSVQRTRSCSSSSCDHSTRT